MITGLSPGTAETLGWPWTATFDARGANADRLTVTPDLLRLEIMPASVFTRSEHSFPLRDVTGVAVRTETRNRARPVPGTQDTALRVPAGEVLVVGLPTGQLVFPAKDAALVRRVVEARVRRQAHG